MGSNKKLPPEILEIVFDNLDECDLALASGVDKVWYSAAEWTLSRRGSTLYRWPHILPTAISNHLCAASTMTQELAATLTLGKYNQ